MRYLALAADYDGTLAHEGRLRAETIAALERLRASGRRAILVTGRELEDLRRGCPRLDLFDVVVAENGAVLFQPQTAETTDLADGPPSSFVERLRARGVPVSAGRVMVATVEPHEPVVLETVRELGLELQLIFNKGAVMVLPSGINKQSGLLAALAELQLSPHNVVAVGDAENDHAMLAAAECGVAVANAVTAVKDRADLVLRKPSREGVEELIERLLADDLRSVIIARHALLLGARRDGTEVRIAPAGRRVLIAGSPGDARTAAAQVFLERLMSAGYQCCLLGDGDEDGMVTAGHGERPPTVDEIVEPLRNPAVHAAASLDAVPVQDRPGFFAALLPRLQQLRSRTGRPHWIAVDEAHTVFPAGWQLALLTVPRDLGGMLLCTSQPDEVSPSVLDGVDTVLAAGETARQVLRRFGEPPMTELQSDEVLSWSNGQIEPLRLVRGGGHKLRRRRRYARGDCGRAFVFSGPDGKQSLRASNVALFVELADGVDEDTWMHHLRRRDYSRWFREAVEDPELAGEAEAIEQTADGQSRARMREAIEKRYTLAD